MKIIRAIAVGILVWILGVSIFIASYFVPLLDNPDLQANLVLSISILLFAWFGTKIYYHVETTTKGIELGAIMVLTAIILDSIFTVPLLIIPQGGSYSSFFGAASFWLITGEYLVVVFLYRQLRI